MSRPRILVAGIGNIFLGDDAFGVEVVARLARRSWPEGVCVADFGIRGFDLAYALMDPWDRVILVDALPRGGAPGTVYVLEPDVTELGQPEPAGNAHGVDPMRVLRLVRALGGTLLPLCVVGCEPAAFGTDEEPATELSPPVRAAVAEAEKVIVSLIARTVSEEAPNHEFDHDRRAGTSCNAPEV
jgi:hydrogenase maturation protease